MIKLNHTSVKVCYKSYLPVWRLSVKKKHQRATQVTKIAEHWKKWTTGYGCTVIIDMRVSVPGRQLLKMCQLQQLLSATGAIAGGARGGYF